ncbi:ferritin-like metal-binding protein YciE [Inquilinus ginsengisoli]|uniref:YciE/YciF ferroxidase family protein n=1 Tax=Inquilinus ginsengisoli TaxID=363840 RepID=UPI003D2152DC
MATKTLHDLFLNELKDLYSAEQQLTRTLPKMARAATNPELKQGFEHHLEQTKVQVERLDTVFKGLEASPRGQSCEAMEGLLAEAQELTELGLEPDALDAALIAAAQKVEHYEIASYGTVCTWAKAMQHDQALTLLLETLAEEKATDETLTKLAKTTVNAAAARHTHPRAA